MRRLRLAGVRLARHMTQEQLAEGMDTTQSAVSRLERQEDILLSTLGDYVAATGGTLIVVAVYAGGDVLPLTEPP